jgi:hypothetical protein
MLAHTGLLQNLPGTMGTFTSITVFRGEPEPPFGQVSVSSGQVCWQLGQSFIAFATYMNEIAVLQKA